MIETYKHFITCHTKSTSAGEEPMYCCRVVNDQYREILVEILDEEEMNIFKKICQSDISAVLFIKHPRLYKLAEFKTKYKNQIFDGNYYP